MVGSHDGDLGQTCRPFAAYLLFVPEDAEAGLLQVEVVGGSFRLPFLSGISREAAGERRGVGQNLCACWQVEGGCQPVVGDGACIFRLGELQALRFALKFIAGDVVFQGSPLAVAGFHVDNQLFGQADVLLQNADLVVEPVQIQIAADKEETHVLAAALAVEFCRTTIQSRHLDAAVYCTAGINDLAGFEGEIVAKMRHGRLHSVAEIPVPQPAIAQVAGREGGGDFRQPLCLCGGKGFIRDLLADVMDLYAPAVFVRQAEQFFQAHDLGLGIDALAA